MAKPTEKINKGNFQVTEKRILIMLRVKTSGFFLQFQELWDHTDPSDGPGGSGACQAA